MNKDTLKIIIIPITLVSFDLHSCEHWVKMKVDWSDVNLPTHSNITKNGFTNWTKEVWNFLKYALLGK
jgi:hypothetical protein